MGNCTKFQKKKHHLKAFQAKNLNLVINIPKLVNIMRSSDIELIIQRLEDVCKHQKRILMNYTLFLTYFPKLKDHEQEFGKEVLKNFFQLFDQSRSNTISPRELINTLAIIYFESNKNLIKIIMYAFGLAEKNDLSEDEFQQFKQNNKDFLKEEEENHSSYHRQATKTMQKVDDDEEPIHKLQMFLTNEVDLDKYRRLFDVFKIDEEKLFIESLLQGNENKQFNEGNKINIQILLNEPVYLIDIKWFQVWRVYIRRYQIVQISFHVHKIQYHQRFTLTEEELQDQKKYIRPDKIQNFRLFQEFEGELKPDLKIFKDFIVFPRHVWKSIQKLYGGGPQIERKSPHFYPLVIYRVFINKTGTAFVPDKIIKYSLSQKNGVKDMLVGEQNLDKKLIYITTNPESDELDPLIYKRWTNIDLTFEFPLEDKQKIPYQHQYITTIDQKFKNIFQQNFLKKEEYFNNSYGDYIKINLSNKFKNPIELQLPPDIALARLAQLKKQGAVVHFIGKQYYCNTFYKYQEIAKIKQSAYKDQEYFPQRQSVIADFKPVLSNNSQYKNSYIRVVLRCLIQAPYFNQYLIKKKYKNQYYKGFQFVSTLIQDLSEIARSNSQTNSKISYQNFHRHLIKKIQRFSDPNKQHRPDELFRQLFTYLNQQIKREYQKFDGQKKENLENGNNKPEEEQVINQENIEKKDEDMQENKDDMYLFKSQNIISRFFNFEMHESLICSNHKCKNITINKSQSPILDLKIDQNCLVFFQGIFHPSYYLRRYKSYKKVKMGVAIKLSAIFQDLANSFIKQIKSIDQSFENIKIENLRFSLEKSGQFRKHFQGEDFKSTLKFLNIKNSFVIMIYQLFFLKQEQRQQIQQLRSKIDMKIDKNGYVDFKNYSEWSIAKVLQYTNQYVKIVNFQYQQPTKIQISRVSTFKTRILEKAPMKIEIIHRKYINGVIQHDIGVNPLIIKITQVMSMIEIEGLIQNELLRYKKKKKIQVQEEEVNVNATQKQIVVVPVKIKKNMSSKAHRFSKQFDGEQIQNTQYSIRYLKHKYGYLCYFCGRKTKLYQKQLKQVVEQLDKFCFGYNCDKLTNQIKQGPIGCYVDLRKLFIVIDWQVDIIENETISHSQYENEKRKINQKSNFSEIQQSFKLFQGPAGEDYVCKNCKSKQAWSKTYITNLPNILIINFNRFGINSNNFQNKISLDLELDLGSVTNPNTQQDDFQLYAIICYSPNTKADDILNLQNNYQIQMQPFQAQLEQKIAKGFWYCYFLQKRKYWIKCTDNMSSFQDINNIKHQQICMLLYRKKNFEAYLASLVF